MPKEGAYFKFQHVRELYDSTTDNLIKYELLENKISNKERDTLIQLLKEREWEYKITTDSDVLISMKFLTNLDNLLFLDADLCNRLGKDTVSH